MAIVGFLAGTWGMAGVPIATSIEIVPPAPTSADTIVVHLSGTWSDSCVPRQAMSLSLGNQIFITLYTQADFNPSIVCLLALTDWSLDVTIGELSPGGYMVIVTHRGNVIATTVFTVTGPAPEEMEVVPNGGFEQGAPGEVPAGWGAGRAFVQRHQRVIASGSGDYTLGVVQEAHCKGSQALYAMAKAVPPQETSQDPSLPFGEGLSYTWVASDWFSAPEEAQAVKLYMRDIEVEGNKGWGWGAYILLVFEDANGLLPNPFAGWETLWNSPQLLYGEKEAMGRVDRSVGTETGNDGSVWRVYTVPIPPELDRSHMNLKIFWIAHNWNSWGPDYWIAISSYVDGLTLSSHPAP